VELIHKVVLSHLAGLVAMLVILEVMELLQEVLEVGVRHQNQGKVGMVIEDKFYLHGDLWKKENAIAVR
jgi:hypothetical protein